MGTPRAGSRRTWPGSWITASTGRHQPLPGRRVGLLAGGLQGGPSAPGRTIGDLPYFMTSLFGVAAFVHEARGLPGGRPPRDPRRDTWVGARRVDDGAHWLAWVMARRGQMDRAWALVRETPVRSATFRPFHDQAFAELLAEPSLGRGPGVRRKQPIVCDRGGPAGSSRAPRSARGAIGHRIRTVRTRSRRSGTLGRGSPAWAPRGSGRGPTRLGRRAFGVRSGRGGPSQGRCGRPDLERAGALIELDRMRSLRDRLG